MTSNDKNEFKICLGIFKRGWEELISTHIYFVCIAAVPIFFSMFFTVMMHNGVPERLPVGIVDQDRSQTSRSIIRTLNSMSAVEAEYYYESFYAANEAIKENKIYAFMEIPEDFERLLYDNKQPEIGFFTNEAYYIAGLFSYKALKLTGHLVNGNIKIKSLSAKGTYPETIQTTIQPIICDLNLLGNPWVNYSYYLSSVFLPAALQLMILLTTVYTLGIKIKRQTSRREQIGRAHV